jgi:hypothetical protein
MKERENVLRIFEETLVAIKNQDTIKLKDLSNQTIHTASTSQDSDNIAVAVIIYSLSKVIERSKSKQDYQKFGLLVQNSLNALKKNDEKSFKKNLELMRKEISGTSGKLKIYIKDVLRKASINKASKIYEHGISMENTAKLLGITMYELASYAGQTDVSDAPESKTLDVKERIKLALDIFK